MTGTQTLDRGRGETIPDGCMRGDYIFILVDVRLLEFAQYRTRWFRFGRMDGCEDTEEMIEHCLLCDQSQLTE